MDTHKILATVAIPYLKTGIPDFRPGDTLKVQVKVVEGESERIQAFEGVVIARKGGGISETFTVRKVSFGIGIERTFPIHSPRIAKIDLVKSGRARCSRSLLSLSAVSITSTCGAMPFSLMLTPPGVK